MAKYGSWTWTPNPNADSQHLIVKEGETVVATSNVSNTQDEFEYGPIVGDGESRTLVVIPLKEISQGSPQSHTVDTGGYPPGTEYVAPVTNLTGEIVEH